MAIDKDPMREHVRRVKTIAAAGVPAPTEWLALNDRLDRFHQSDCVAMRESLAQALIDNDPDVSTFRALAMAEALESQAAARVNPHIRGRVYQRLLELYGAVAQDNYTTVANKFNQLGQKFSVAADVVDPELPAEQAARLTDKPRRAWVDAADVAVQIDALITPLSAAAIEAGIHDAKGDGLLGLCCMIPDGAHRRRVWEAWSHKDGRCGRWAALHKVGVKLRAAPVGEFKMYLPPRPLEVRMQNGHSITVDPEGKPLPLVAT